MKIYAHKLKIVYGKIWVLKTDFVAALFKVTGGGAKVSTNSRLRD